MKLSKIGYLIGSGIKGIFTHGFMSFASVTVIVACLVIMGSFSMLVVNINTMIDELEGQNEIVAYIDESLSKEEAEAMKAELEAISNVSSVEFMTREEAMESFQEEYEDSIFDDIDPSTFRHRYVVRLTDISLMENTKASLESVDGVAKVNAHLEYARGFITVRNVVSVISIILVAILLVVSLFIMTNTIKIATFTRREEIAIMKMVGASNAFIRCPFVVEGLALGAFGGGLAFGLQWGMYEIICKKVVTGFTGTIISVVPFSQMAYPMLGAFMTIGILVGVIGGSTAIRNYLKV